MGCSLRFRIRNFRLSNATRPRSGRNERSLTAAATLEDVEGMENSSVGPERGMFLRAVYMCASLSSFP